LPFVGCGPNLHMPHWHSTPVLCGGLCQETAPFPGYRPIPISIKIEGYPENGFAFTQLSVQITSAKVLLFVGCGPHLDRTISRLSTNTNLNQNRRLSRKRLCFHTTGLVDFLRMVRSTNGPHPTKELNSFLPRRLNFSIQLAVYHTQSTYLLGGVIR
jgi:hypothetical protein